MELSVSEQETVTEKEPEIFDEEGEYMDRVWRADVEVRGQKGVEDDSDLERED